MGKFGKTGSPVEMSELDELCAEIRNKAHDHITQVVAAMTRGYRDRAASSKRQLDAVRFSSKTQLSNEVNRRLAVEKQLAETQARVAVLTARLKEAADIPTAVEAIPAE